MTREEAISIMNVIVHMLEPQYDTDRIEDAVEMAIKALDQLTSYEQTINKLTKAISEQEPTTHGYMLVCPNCGLDVHSDFESCPRCGAKMESEEER